MKVQFELTVKVIGSSLQEVDDGLVQAAGERLRARMTVGPLGAVPNIPSMVKIKTEQKEVQNEQTSTVEAKDTPATSQSISAEGGEKSSRRKTKAKEEKTEIKEEKEDVQKTPLTKDDAIAAIGRVNAKFGAVSPTDGINKVKECLAKFGAPSVTKMDSSVYREFITHCDSICG